MAVEIEIIEHEAFLEVLVTGVYDLEEAADRTSVILLACRTSGKSKVFIDSTGLIPTTSAVEKVLYVSYLREHYENHLASGGEKLKIAYFDSSRQRSTYEPGIETATIYGLPTNVFTTKQDALNWLGVEEPL